MPQTIFLTGANGFIAQHVVGMLLDQGYRVIGTVRSEEKSEWLTQQFSDNPNLSTTVVPDLSDADAFDTAFAVVGPEVDVVIHMASPLQASSGDYEHELLIPAVRGTESIFGAIKRFGSDRLKHVVLTSSMSAVRSTSQLRDSKYTATEQDWNDFDWDNCQTDNQSAYAASKKLAELTAWNLAKDTSYQLTTVNPSLIFGPQRFAGGSSNSGLSLIQKLLKARSSSQIPDNVGQFVDVRDAAKAHLRAFQNPDCAGHRLLLCTANYCSQDILDTVHEHFPNLSEAVARGNPGTGSVIVRDRCSHVNDSVTRELLGFPLRTLHESIVDTLESEMSRT